MSCLHERVIFYFYIFNGKCTVYLSTCFFSSPFFISALDLLFFFCFFFRIGSPSLILNLRSTTAPSFQYLVLIEPYKKSTLVCSTILRTASGLLQSYTRLVQNQRCTYTYTAICMAFVRFGCRKLKSRNSKSKPCQLAIQMKRTFHCPVASDALV